MFDDSDENFLVAVADDDNDFNDDDDEPQVTNDNACMYL